MSSQQTATVYAEGVRMHRREKQSLEENQMQQWETSTGMGLWKLYEEELKYNAECFITPSSKLSFSHATGKETASQLSLWKVRNLPHYQVQCTGNITFI